MGSCWVFGRDTPVVRCGGRGEVSFLGGLLELGLRLVFRQCYVGR